MRSKMRLLLLFIPMAMLVLMYQQCSNVNFRNTDQQSQWSNECSKDSSRCKVVTETFNAGTSNKKIDFTWIVDNSASMKDEVLRVKNNIATFSDELGQYTDLKMLLVSAKDSTTNPNNAFQGGPNYFSLPAMPSGVQALQLNTLVRSRDALIVGGLGLCPVSAPADSWCSKVQANHLVYNANSQTADSKIADSQWNTQYMSVLSKIGNFAREQSHKVFVIVTDDDATTGEYHTKSNEFLDAYNSRFPNAQPLVYAIASPRTVADAKAAGCAVYRQAVEYTKLTALTGGEVFDICASDWMPYFNKMLAGIQVLARTSFPLATVKVIDILSVKVNGVALNSGDYTYANRTLAIREDILAGFTNFDVTVEILEYVE